MSGDSSKSAFKVQVKVGGVNIIQHQHQHTLNGKDGKDGKKIPPLQDYFVVSEQQWIWGTQVGKDTARQFRVFGRRRERYVPFSLPFTMTLSSVSIRDFFARPDSMIPTLPLQNPNRLLTSATCQTLPSTSTPQEQPRQRSRDPNHFTPPRARQ